MIHVRSCPWCKEPFDPEEGVNVGDITVCEICENDHRCRNCNGSGESPVLRDEHGRIDYLRGAPTGEMDRCDSCHGEGYRL
jgi:hypothetical protein